MNRTINHYDALGYAEGWNLVAAPRTARNLMDVKAEIETDLAATEAPWSRNTSAHDIKRRILKAKLAGFQNALAVLMGGSGNFGTEITIVDGPPWAVRCPAPTCGAAYHDTNEKRPEICGVCGADLYDQEN